MSQAPDISKSLFLSKREKDAIAAGPDDVAFSDVWSAAARVQGSPASMVRWAQSASAAMGDQETQTVSSPWGLRQVYGPLLPEEDDWEPSVDETVDLMRGLPMSALDTMRNARSRKHAMTLRL